MPHQTKQQFWEFSQRYASSGSSEGHNITDIIDDLFQYGKTNSYLIDLYSKNKSFLYRASFYFYDNMDNERYTKYMYLVMPLSDEMVHIVTPQHTMETMETTVRTSLLCDKDISSYYEYVSASVCNLVRQKYGF